jgi:hypothetical protein
VRRLLGWTAGAVGIAALARALTRRRPRYEPLPATSAPPVDDRAEALRRKLDETRALQETHDTPSAQKAASQAAEEESPDTIEERRARVHAKAQEAIRAMQEPLG